MTVGRVNYGSWFSRVLGWDGLLPVCIALIPTFVKLLISNNREVVEAAGVLLPLAAFFVRLFIGIRHIRSNHCGSRLRFFQFVVFFLAILLFVCVDTLLILSDEMPKGAMFVTSIDYLVFAIMYSIYLTSMTFAMYPGRANSLDGTLWSEDAFDLKEL